MSTCFGSVRCSKRYCSFTKRSRLGRLASCQEAGEEMVAQYHAPAWLMNRAWEVQVIKAISGWTFRPRTFNLIPHHSHLFTLAGFNDIKGIQELFQEKRASPYDCTENGWTALHVRQHVHLTKLFLRAESIVGCIPKQSRYVRIFNQSRCGCTT